MGPALERLLARPSALNLLRFSLRRERNLDIAQILYHPVCQHAGKSAHHAAAPPQTRIRRLQSEKLREPQYVPISERVETGKESFERLRFEADVTSALTDKARLVDDPSHMKDANLWLELLRFRKRVDGANGVQEIWQGIKTRGVLGSLEGQVDVHNALWQLFISTARSHTDWMEDVLDHVAGLSQPSGLAVSVTYGHVIGYHLREQPQETMTWYSRLERLGLVPWNSASSLLHDVVYSKNPQGAFPVLKEIYKRSSERNLYDRSIAKMLKHRAFPFTYAWHKFLIAHKDLPSSAVKADPWVQTLDAYGTAERSQPETAKRVFKKASRPRSTTPALFSRENMNTIVGDVHGIREKKLGDAFCARLFATSAFSLDFVISGLKMFGLESIGPLALRELAARCMTVAEFDQTMSTLRTAKISITHCAFSQALQKFASEDRQQLFNVLLQSDRHPDTYDDLELQRRLLTTFLEQQRLPDAQATVEIITMTEPDPERASWNLLLQTYCSSSSHDHIMQILNDMQVRRVPLDDASLGILHHMCLRTRSRGKRPKSWVNDNGQQLDDLAFVTNVFRVVARSGQEIRPNRWHEQLRRYGMSGRIRGLENLCTWLVETYSSQPAQQGNPDPQLTSSISQSLRSPTGLPKSHPLHPLNMIFRGSLQRAIIAWNFKSALLSAETDSGPGGRQLEPSPRTRSSTMRRRWEPEPWARGLGFLRYLRSRGVSIRTDLVRKEVILRLWILYGPGRSTLRSNRRMKINMTHTIGCSLADCVMHLEAVWNRSRLRGKSSLFKLKNTVFKKDPQEMEERLHKALFGGQRSEMRRRMRRIGSVANRGGVARFAINSRRARQMLVLDNAIASRRSGA